MTLIIRLPLIIISAHKSCMVNVIQGECNHYFVTLVSFKNEFFGTVDCIRIVSRKMGKFDKR